MEGGMGREKNDIGWNGTSMVFLGRELDTFAPSV